ncbi:MAG: Gfo/Idh/MocA family oxidoreductase [Bacteroidota bacterium]|nr:Gfo/Idh/MocA family oxidoreductase [Bacteroidota bacterium]
MQSLINKYKRIRKNKFLEKTYTGKYAFVGIGSHSFNNLYPVLAYLHADLSYIVTKTEATAKTINENYKSVKGTTNLDKVLKDKNIKGVFVSAHPDAHFELAKQILQAGKNVFIEKPPCKTLKELQELRLIEKDSSGSAFVGLQKRHAPVYQIIRNKVKSKKVIYYKLEYSAGNYPEGDTITDLFIHPLDLAVFIYGPAKIEFIKKFKTGKGVETWLLELSHPDDIIGRIELSTDFWWTRGQENMIINTEKHRFEAKGINELKYIDKPKSIMNVPLEKIKAPVISEHSLYQKNNFLPVRDHNDLYASGYFNEIQAFLEMCEHNEGNISTLDSMVPVYELMDKMKK